MINEILGAFTLLTIAGLILAIIFARKLFKTEKHSREHRLFKHRMWYSLIGMFIFGALVNVVGNNTTNDNTLSNNVDNASQTDTKKVVHHKPVHHSNNWKIQNEMPKTVSDDNMNFKTYVEGEFSTPKYTMNLFVNDPDYTNAKDGTTRVISILNDMKKYDYKDFSDVGIVLQSKLQDNYGRNLGYRPVDVYSFKASDISKMQPLQMDGNDLESIATEHDVKPVSGN